MNTISLFVYGTLRIGYGNYERYLSKNTGVEYIGPAVTTSRFALYCASIPFLHKSPELTNIHGDVFQISDPIVMKNIDALEGHQDNDKSGYHREVTPVLLENGQIILAWCYFYYGTKYGDIVLSGDWLKR